jgi:hypothetical protein
MEGETERQKDKKDRKTETNHEDKKREIRQDRKKERQESYFFMRQCTSKNLTYINHYKNNLYFLIKMTKLNDMRNFEVKNAMSTACLLVKIIEVK